MTSKDLCLLHARDPVGTPRRTIARILNAPDAGTHSRDDTPLSWTDLQTLLQSASGNACFPALRQAGRISDEQARFFEEAARHLKERRAAGPRGPFIHAFANIHDVVWDIERPSVMPAGAFYAWRGQFRAQWPMESSLLRPEPGGFRVATLIERVRLTEAFLAAVRPRQKQIFGARLDEDSLEAVAQHFGFPTPLLDFTRSLRVAAFFATLDARRWAGGEPVCGILYRITVRESRAFADPGAELGFSLAAKAGVRVGEMSFVEPAIPDADNRIRRQSGFFVRGFESHDLSNYVVDRFLFWQQPGEVFEDPREGIDEATLLPDRTPLTAIAAKVRRSCPPAGRAPGWSPQLLVRGIIGSRGALLKSQLDEANRFFATLAETAGRAGEDLEPVARAVQEYFDAALEETYVGQIPKDGTCEAPDTLIFHAVSSLAEWSGLDLNALWDHIYPRLPRQYEYGGPSEKSAPVPRTAKQRMALACALYLAGWEHLREVGGTVAKRLAGDARLVLLQ